MLESYQYRPLLNPQTIRVLELEPALKRTSPLKGRLIEVDLDAVSSQQREYDALSYVWGSSEGDQPIVFDNKQLRITQNCDSALRQLRSRTRKIRLWVDAVCINQQDLMDRGHQVNMMGKIYQRARKVHIWLGSYAPSEGVLRTKFCFAATDVGLVIKSLPLYHYIEPLMDQIVQLMFDLSK